jgi:DNA-binding response OmpR family regulator
VRDSSPPEAYIVIKGESGREVHRLDRLPCTIGRAPDSDLLINDPRVSRSHASVDWSDGSFQLRDLDSTNGTLVNNAPAGNPASLKDGDAISFAGVPAEFQVNAPTMVAPVTPTGGLSLNAATHEVTVDGKQVDLSPKEFLFLAALHGHGGEVVSHTDIAREVWPEYDEPVPDENIHQLATRLRRKLEPDAAEPRFVITVKGFGYRLST